MTRAQLLRPEFIDGEVQAINLTQSVVVSGRDIFGKKAYLKFVPVLSSGWYRDTGNIRERLWSIYPESVVVKKRRLVFVDSDRKSWLEYIEHITPLRLLGLDSVCISCFNKKGKKSIYPPYLLAGELWERLSPHLVHADYFLDWNEPAGRGVFLSGEKKVIICPSVGVQKGTIGIHTVTKYDNLPQVDDYFLYNEKFDWRMLRDVLMAPTKGHPTGLKLLVKVAEFFGWPHGDRVHWSQRTYADVEKAARTCNLHRMQDMMGAIGAMSLTGKKLPSCQFHSFKAGHAEDIMVFREALGIELGNK